MNPGPYRANVTVRNRQRVLDVDTRLLKKVAREALTLTGQQAALPLPAGGEAGPVSFRGRVRGNVAPPTVRSQLSLVLVDDREIARLNAQYHHTAGPTDVLAFDYGDGVGELIVSVERAQAQAGRFRTTTARELALYVAHGLLHLHGRDDRTPRQRALMRAAERRLLGQLAQAFDLQSLTRW